VLGILDALSVPKVGDQETNGKCAMVPPMSMSMTMSAYVRVLAGVLGGQGLRYHTSVRLRAAAPYPHPRRDVPGHALQPRPLQLRRHHA
jgi:hypothetical protein